MRPPLVRADTFDVDGHSINTHLWERYYTYCIAARPHFDQENADSKIKSMTNGKQGPGSFLQSKMDSICWVTGEVSAPKHRPMTDRFLQGASFACSRFHEWFTVRYSGVRSIICQRTCSDSRWPRCSHGRTGFCDRAWLDHFSLPLSSVRGGIFATNVLRPERKRVYHLYPLLVRGSTEQDGDVHRFRVLLSALSSGSDTRFGGETCGMCIFTLSLSTERVSHVRRVFSLMVSFV